MRIAAISAMPARAAYGRQTAPRAPATVVMPAPVAAGPQRILSLTSRGLLVDVMC